MAQIPIEEYEKLVLDAFATGSSMPFPNGLPDHAVVIMKAIFAYSSSHVRLYSRALSPTYNLDGTTVALYSDEGLIQAARRFLSKPDSVLDILVDDESNIFAKGGLVSALKEEFLEKLNLRKTSGSCRNNMMVGDTQSFRFETSINDIAAIASANSPDVARDIAENFDQYFLEGVKIS